MMKNKFLFYLFFPLLYCMPSRGNFTSVISSSISSRQFLIAANIGIILGVANACKNYFLSEKKTKALLLPFYAQEDSYQKWVSSRLYIFLKRLSRAKEDCRRFSKFMMLDEKFMQYDSLPDYEKIQSNTNIFNEIISEAKFCSPAEIEDFLFKEEDPIVREEELAERRRKDSVLYVSYYEKSDPIELNIEIDERITKRCYIKNLLLSLMNREDIFSNKNNILADLCYIVNTFGNIVQVVGLLAFMLVLITQPQEELAFLKNKFSFKINAK